MSGSKSAPGCTIREPSQHEPESPAHPEAEPGQTRSSQVKAELRVDYPVQAKGHKKPISKEWLTNQLIKTKDEPVVSGPGQLWPCDIRYSLASLNHRIHSAASSSSSKPSCWSWLALQVSQIICAGSFAQGRAGQGRAGQGRAGQGQGTDRA